ncbi:MAG: acetyl-CoA carboxylase biotin carboxyl carrier protein [Candidatus Omnitrophota bacterium]|nr:acetyl-CoA carboxylase biotin carboxyl carrier protein [Candidatus Omnitrophota bacterium]
MEIEKLKEFIAFMEENNLCELEIEEEGKRIKLKKAGMGQQPAFISAPTLDAVLNLSAGGEKKQDNLIEIKSPMVGTFYRSPAPGVKPYMEVGEVIKPGDVVCIVEAMKLMNEIKAEVGGRVVKIAVENGDSVEFGQPLFFIEPV